MFACSRHWECVEREPSIHHHHQTHTHTHTGTCLHTHTHSFGSQSGFFFSPGLQGGAEPKVNISRVEAKWRSCGGSNHRHVKQTPAAQVETRGLSGPREGALSLRISALSDGSWSCDFSLWRFWCVKKRPADKVQRSTRAAQRSDSQSSYFLCSFKKH